MIVVAVAALAVAAFSAAQLVWVVHYLRDIARTARAREQRESLADARKAEAEYQARNPDP